MFNKIVIIGRLGFPPSLKTTKTGTSMCSFAVAVNTGWGDNKATDWYNVTTFGKLADVCSKTLSKGSLVCVTGSVQLREHESKDGQKKMRLELTADTATFLDAKVSNQSSGQQQNQPQPTTQVQDDMFGDAGDGIPF